MSATDRLSVAIAAVERSLAATEAKLADEIARQHSYGFPPLTPDDMKDMHGRYILLDARIALVNGLAALARAEKSK